MIPYVATFASFLALLCCEQIRTDVAYTRLPVRLIGHHTGITLGFYGTSHHATEDIAIMRAIARPHRRRTRRRAVARARRSGRRSTIRARSTSASAAGRDPEVYGDGIDFELGRAIVHGAGADLTIIATARWSMPALEAAERLCAPRATRSA